METMSIRLGDKLVREIQKCMADFNYSTKTEFVREAIREKISKVDKERALRTLSAYRGALKGKSVIKTEEDYQRMKREVSEELRAKLDKRFQLK